MLRQLQIYLDKKKTETVKSLLFILHDPAETRKPCKNIFSQCIQYKTMYFQWNIKSRRNNVAEKVCQFTEIQLRSDLAPVFLSFFFLSSLPLEKMPTFQYACDTEEYGTHIMFI